MDENTKQSALKILEDLNKDIEDLIGVPGASLPTDEIIPHAGLAINTVGDEWIPTTNLLWRSWTGRRKVWGMEYHGPVYNVDQPDDSAPYTGRRMCTCTTCQEHVVPSAKPN